MPDTAGSQPAPDEFTSTYGKLMALAGRLDDQQMSDLRALDGVLTAAEHVLAGTPVGAGAHSAICGFIMNAYAAGRVAGRGTPDGDTQ